MKNLFPSDEERVNAIYIFNNAEAAEELFEEKACGPICISPNGTVYAEAIAFDDPEWGEGYKCPQNEDTVLADLEHDWCSLFIDDSIRERKFLFDDWCGYTLEHAVELLESLELNSAKAFISKT